jgi:dolichol-phosphate mannosyltransferase
MKTDVNLTIIVPVYNEEEVLPETIRRLLGIQLKLPQSTEIIFVDDGSSDNSLVILRDAVRRSPDYLKLVILSRNFGHQNAVSAGLDYARGAAVAVIDGDLQDPPELIPEFYRILQNGYDVVYGVRANRKEGFFKRGCYKCFYRLMSLISSIEIPIDSGDFCIMSRRVVEAINKMPENHRFVRGLRAWVGFPQVAFQYDRPERERGTSKYTYLKLLRLALDGIITFSEVPLRMSSLLGLAIALFSFCYFCYVISWSLLKNLPPPGITTIAAALFLLGGVQLITIGILGEYVARIHNETKRRPIYVVMETTL